MNEVVRICFAGTDLSSRSYAKEQRELVESYLIKGNNLTIDLRNVESISHSFADELFAVLYAEVGEELFARKIKLIVKNKDLIQIISDSIRQRCDLQNA